MKAAIYHQYGAPEVLQLTDLETPTPEDNEVLIRIHATTVTSGDWRTRKGDPFVIRFVSGLRKPKHQILGHELAGEIVATGKKVHRFKKGDRVFGSTGFMSGTYAQYIALPEDSTLTIIPENMTYEEATTVPVGALTALFFLRKGNILPGKKVLIHGASGAIGTAAVQIAKSFGAEVTGVCSTVNMEMVKSLGADKVIDYRKKDFTESSDIYDIIFNTVGKTSYTQAKKVLSKQGKYVASAASLLDYVQMLSPTVGRQIVAGVAKVQKEDLIFIKSLIEEGALKSVTDRYYPLEEIAQAHRYVEKGHKKGNVVITIPH